MSSLQDAAKSHASSIQPSKSEISPLLNVPVEMVLAITARLEPQEIASLALTCKAIFLTLGNERFKELSGQQKSLLLALLNRDKADHIHCHACEKLHPFLRGNLWAKFRCDRVNALSPNTPSVRRRIRALQIVSKDIVFGSLYGRPGPISNPFLTQKAIYWPHDQENPCGSVTDRFSQLYRLRDSGSIPDATLTATFNHREYRLALPPSAFTFFGGEALSPKISICAHLYISRLSSEIDFDSKPFGKQSQSFWQHAHNSPDEQQRIRKPRANINWFPACILRHWAGWEGGHERARCRKCEEVQQCDRCFTEFSARFEGGEFVFKVWSSLGDVLNPTCSRFRAYRGATWSRLRFRKGIVKDAWIMAQEKLKRERGLEKSESESGSGRASQPSLREYSAVKRLMVTPGVHIVRRQDLEDEEYYEDKVAYKLIK